MVTARVRSRQTVLEEDTDALNDSVSEGVGWCECHHSHEIPKPQEERREMAEVIESI